MLQKLPINQGTIQGQLYNELFGTFSDFGWWCRCSSVSRQSFTSEEAVMEFTQDNQGLWIERWPYLLHSVHWPGYLKIHGLSVQASTSKSLGPGSQLKESGRGAYQPNPTYRSEKLRAILSLSKQSKVNIQVRQWLQAKQGKRGLLVLTGPAGIAEATL